MNTAVITGRLTRDAKERQVGEHTLAEFSIAQNDGYGDKKKTYYFDIQAWGKTAENTLKYTRKGSNVAVAGKLVQDRWEDKDGNKRNKVFINANQVEFLDPKDSSGEEAPSKSRFDDAR